MTIAIRFAFARFAGSQKRPLHAELQFRRIDARRRSVGRLVNAGAFGVVEVAGRISDFRFARLEDRHDAVGNIILELGPIVQFGGRFQGIDDADSALFTLEALGRHNDIWSIVPATQHLQRLEIDIATGRILVRCDPDEKVRRFRAISLDACEDLSGFCDNRFVGRKAGDIMSQFHFLQRIRYQRFHLDLSFLIPLGFRTDDGLIVYHKDEFRVDLVLFRQLHDRSFDQSQNSFSVSHDRQVVEPLLIVIESRRFQRVRVDHKSNVHFQLRNRRLRLNGLEIDDAKCDQNQSQLGDRTDHCWLISFFEAGDRIEKLENE